MASTQAPDAGTNFWAALGFDQDAPDQEHAAGSGAGKEPQIQWADLFSGPPAPAPRPQPPAPAERTTAAPVAANGSAARPAADQAWLEAERVAGTIRPRLAEAWIDMLTREVGGDRDLARKVFQVLAGMHVLTDLWRDRRVEEIHVNGTRVTVSGTQGVREVPGFHNAAAARQAIAAVEAKQETLGAVVTHAGDSVVVGRARHNRPDAAALIDSGVVTQDLVDEVGRALEEVRAVTVSGPAAWVVMRAFAPLIPSGSRVFQGPLAVLPPGCVAATSPLDADYVLGVRPGTVAEEVAAAGHVGALVANPKRRFEAAVELVVSGRSTAPDKVVTR